MGILRTAGRAAVASSVHGRVQRRQQARWAQQSVQQAPVQQVPVQQVPVQQAPAPQVTPAAPQAETTSINDQLAQLTQLGQLRDAGVLTDAEFEAKKTQILQL